MVITRTPFRISFFGGGTDYPAWYRNFDDGVVISTTIDKYCYITCRAFPPFFDHKLRAVWSKIELGNNPDDIVHPSVRETLKFFGVQDGIEVHHNGDLPARSGLGSSSAFTVGFLHALHALGKKETNKHQLAKDAIHIEQNLIKENVGSQDQVAAAFGGFNKIIFHRSGDVEVVPLSISKPKLEDLENRLMLFFTGLARTASEVVPEQIKNTPKKEKELKRMLELVAEAEDILTTDRPIDDFGRLLDEAWQLKKQMSSVISNQYIDEIYETGKKAGALGGKLLGAGSGGFVIFYVPLEKQSSIKEALKHLLHVSFRFENAGSQVIYYNPTEFEPTYLQKSKPARGSQNLKNVDALVLVGGLGTRLRPVVSDRPKPIAKLKNKKPFLDLILEDLFSQGVRRVVLAIGHMGDQIKKRYEKDRRIVFSYEDKPLGTGGAIKNAKHLIRSDHFLVLNGDSLCKVNLDEFYQSHIQENKPLSIVLSSCNERFDVGRVSINEKNEIVSFQEKEVDSKTPLINAGIYMMHRNIFDEMPPKEVFSLEHDLFPKVASRGHIVDAEVMDIGTPERYEKYSATLGEVKKLHLGCGEKYLPGYINIDFPPYEHSVIKIKADMYADIRTLSYPDNSIDEIRTHHMFEHFPRAEALKLLSHWRRWLKPGGKIMIETPDFLACARSYAMTFSNKRRLELGRHVFGSEEASWAHHYDFWDKPKLKYILSEFGFKNIKIKRYKNSLASHYPHIPFLNLIGNLLPRSLYKKYGGHKLPNIIATANKDNRKIDEEKIVTKILSQYLVGKEGQDLLDVWLKKYRD
ncbi:MAG: NTP transferase domain-containing protein [Anaplasmataceae bacterium]|nr:NTP transferase domain-containing protein [Anaplasmataceae bacterium]